MSDVPSPETGRIGEKSGKSTGLTDEEIEAQLAKLRA